MSVFFLVASWICGVCSEPLPPPDSKKILFRLFRPFDNVSFFPWALSGQWGFGFQAQKEVGIQASVFS